MGKYKIGEKSERFTGVLWEFGIRSEQGKKAVLSIVKKKQFSKGQVLQDTICNNLLYIERGLTRIFYRKDGKEITEWINAEFSFIPSFSGFVTREPDHRIIEFLEPTTLYSIHHDAIEKLSDRSHEIERFLRYLTEFGLYRMQEKLDELNFSTTLDRYHKFMQTDPSLMVRVPPGVLASYMGIKEEDLEIARRNETLRLSFG